MHQIAFWMFMNAHIKYCKRTILCYECLQVNLIDVICVYCTQLADIQPWPSFGNIFVKAANNLLSLHQELRLVCVWTALGPVRFMPGVRWNTTRDLREHPLFSCSTLEICHFVLALLTFALIPHKGLDISQVYWLQMKPVKPHFFHSSASSLSSPESPCWAKLRTSPSTSRISSGFQSLNSQSKWLCVEPIGRVLAV